MGCGSRGPGLTDSAPEIESIELLRDDVRIQFIRGASFALDQHLPDWIWLPPASRSDVALEFLSP